MQKVKEHRIYVEFPKLAPGDYIIIFIRFMRIPKTFLGE